MISQKVNLTKTAKCVILGSLVLAIVFLPIFAFSAKKSHLYVNEDAKGTQNGSWDHPYKTISQAIDKANGRTDIHVSNGEYEENITLKNGVRLFGEDKDKTIIKADKSKWSTIYVKENSEINGFTIEGGKRGVWIDKYAETSIVDCIVKNNDKDGIGIEGGKDTKKENSVVISKTTVKKNGKAGIYSNGKRRVIIINSDILENGSDGIDLYAGTSAWIAENRIKDNRGSGMKLAIDNSNIWTKDNSIRENKREGVEVTFSGAAGRIDLAKSKIVDNGNFGIAKLHKTGASTSLWAKYLTQGNKTEFWGNSKGSVSGAIWAK